MSDTEVTRTHRRGGLGLHGFAYLDSAADTGPTHIPRHACLAGGTGQWGDPRWESLVDPKEEFLIFPYLCADAEVTLPREHGYQVDILVLVPSHPPAAVPFVDVGPPVALDRLLSEMRSQAALPVGDLARMLGVSRRQFYNWLSSEHHPDSVHETRVRKTAQLIADLHARVGTPRLVRSVLLTPTVNGSAYDALRNGDLAWAELAIETVLGAPGGPGRSASSPTADAIENRQQAMLELSELRDAAPGGDD